MLGLAPLLLSFVALSSASNPFDAKKPTTTPCTTHTAQSSTPTHNVGKGCKCTSSDSCWPSQSEWDILSRQLSHPVFNVVPPGYYCHDPNYNAALCNAAKANSANSIWRSDQPGAEQSDNWEFILPDACLINGGNQSTPCSQGRVPAIGVNATTAADVQIALKFAYDRNLKVHIKNTGHDFLGRGLGPGSLMIWTHHFRGQTFSKNFQYANGKKSGFPSITVHPGEQWVDTYGFAAENNVLICGGIGPLGSVGSGGGWPLGGGHNILSRHFGMGADNLLELDIVLPNGKLVTVNQYQNTDLFWAVRGGGGPSFGVAVRLVHKVHPDTTLFASFFEALTATPDAFVSLLDLFHESLPALSDAGWSGYYPFEAGSYFALMYLLPAGNTTYSNATMGVFTKAAAAIPGVTIKTDATTTYPGYQSWFDQNILHPDHVIGFNYTGSAVAGVGVDTASWLLPRDLFSNKTSAHAMSEAILAMPAGIGQHVAGGVVAETDPDFNAIHPSWRKSLVDVSIFGAWADNATQPDVNVVRQGVTDLLAPLRDLTPGVAGGQYLNEPDLLVPDWPHANWGYHYERLLTIKKKYDPTNQLLVVQGVGSDGWDSEQICPL
ncbi:hypothetical protein FB45DRAFT_798999 [Roridomyces roridus]|uniref:FAD-binding PCMH-type domain-containing protein n=1 Tax=Roridomyces roridus TaxID=1738132 RepID=A0AAD7BI30_9AGAR|nr:hypothetical protein FB45DRAFT_798999 [Roridomyces roridus]